MPGRKRISVVVVGSLLLAYRIAVAYGNAVKLVVGDYLTGDYIKTLDRTRSPLAAEAGRSINLVVVQREDGYTRIQSVIRFHEGGPSFRIGRSGQGVLLDAAGQDVGAYVVRALNGAELEVGFKGLPVTRFIAVRDLQGFILRKSVGGTYVDDKGQSYVFGPGGLATTPKGRFKFTVGVDHVPYRFDYLEVSGTHMILRFVRKQCALDIYEVTDAETNQAGNDGTHARPWAFLHETGCTD